MGEYGDLFNAAVAAELRAQRSRARITIDKLVESTGISRSAVLNYLNGKRDISVPTLRELCRALGISPVEVFDLAEKATQEH
jgi:transcriptional regulator with XRE-family HTH domain